MKSSKAPEMDVPSWDESRGKWVYWRERQTGEWIRAEAEMDFDKWNHPGFWMMKDIQLNDAASFLWNTYEAHHREPPVKGRPPVTWFPSTALMLAAMSVECFLKAALFCRLRYPPSREAAATVTRGAHDLPSLLAKVGWRSNQTDRRLLTVLSHSVRWDGRYPLPRSAAELAESRLVQSPSRETWLGYEAFREKFGRRLSSELRNWGRVNSAA